MPQIPDYRIIETVELLFEDGERDKGNGGVHISKIAEHLDCTRGGIEGRLEKMEEHGKLESVMGVGEKGVPRKSWMTPEQLEETHTKRERGEYTKEYKTMSVSD